MAELIKYLNKEQAQYLVQKIREEIPTALSQLTNDKNFIDNTVDNLANYYSKTVVDEKIGALATIEISIVDALPAEGKSNIIYLVPKAEGAENSNLKDEYLWNATDSVFEKIGDTAIDLSGYLKTDVAAQTYATKEELSTEQGKITTLEGRVKSLEEGTYDDTDVRNLIQGNTDAIEEIEKDYLKAADKEALEAELAKKANAATTLSGYGITDAYTKSEVDGLVASTFHYMGTKATYAELPTEGNKIGDVWNITAADKTNGIKAGDNVAWNGTGWDVLAGTVDLSAYSTTEEMNAAINAANADKITLADLSAETTGDGNVVTAVTYDPATGKFTATKGITLEAITQAEIDAMFA